MENNIKKTADKTSYMREYKRQKYKENGELIRQKNREYYKKYKYGTLSDEELQKYESILPQIIKLRKMLNDINKINSDLVKDFLVDYIEKTTI